MASPSAARLAGDDYQHVFAWAQALELLMPKHEVRAIIVEDGDAGSADDVTVLHAAASQRVDRYHQIKYHVDQRGVYDEDTLLAQKGEGRSLLQKWFDSWELLRKTRPGRPAEVHVVSNWTPSPQLGPLLSGEHNGFREEFFTAPATSPTGQLMLRWVQHVGASEDRFIEFARALHIRLSYCCQQDMAQIAADRMEYLGLKSDGAALLVAAGIVRRWIRAGRIEITSAALDAAIDEHRLRLPTEGRPAVAVHLVTIKSQAFEIPPDYLLDWRSHFTGDDSKRGHELLDPADWQGKLTPELTALEARINSETPVRLIKARGLARLSAWFAFGFVFSEVNRYTIEIDQQGQQWATDAPPSPDFAVSAPSPDGETLEGPADVVAVGVSVTGEIEADVRRHLTEGASWASAILLLKPNRPLGRGCLRSAGDVVALADGVKPAVREFVKRRGATRVLLYYFGPLSGACFIGHRLNAVCREVVIMERADPTYVPSFRLQ